MRLALAVALLAACKPDPKDSFPHDSALDSGEDDTAEPDSHPSDDTDPPTDDTDSPTDDTDPPTDDTAPPKPTHAVILFIGDGMGMEHVKGGGLYANGASGTLSFESMPYIGREKSASLTGLTDSAASATAMATGYKTWNGVVGLDRDDTPVQNVVELARDYGLATGVVTTDRLTGATPASFLSHVSSRGADMDIAEQIAATLPDVLLGGGRRTMAPFLEGVDIQRVETRDQLLVATDEGRPLVGLFADDEMPWVADGLGDAPSLADMTTTAIAMLEDDEQGFFLMVEGARIDHASHANQEERAHPETAAFSDAIAAAIDWAEGRDDVTIIVTADHECGGMRVADTGAAGTIPDTEWRWGGHTNADPGIFAMGPKTELFDGMRLDNRWIHSALVAAITDEELIPPSDLLLVDGALDDLGSAVTTQAWDTSFGAGFNQLDAMRVSADGDGLRIGIDGAFEMDQNAVILYLDVDYGDSTGLGPEATGLPDTDGNLESILSAVQLDVTLSGLGFDFAMVSDGAQELEWGALLDSSGLRGLRDPWAADGDLWWLPAESLFDDGNLAIDGEPAPDAAATGLSEDGYEVLIPWYSLYPDGMPADGLNIAIFAALVNSDGDFASNQTLPPLATDSAPGGDPIPVESVVTLSVAADGTVMDGPVVAP